MNLFFIHSHIHTPVFNSILALPRVELPLLLDEKSALSQNVATHREDKDPPGADIPPEGLWLRRFLSTITEAFHLLLPCPLCLILCFCVHPPDLKAQQSAVMDTSCLSHTLLTRLINYQ